jgi:hypothetical protein
VDRLFNVVEYFASLYASRHDDPLTAEWKFLQLRAWICIPVALVAFGLCVGLANFLDIMDGNALLRPMSEAWRPTVAYLALGALGLIYLFALYSWWSVYRFAKKHGAE